MWALYTLSILNLTFEGCHHFPTTAVLNYFLIIYVKANRCLSLRVYMVLYNLLIYECMSMFLCFEFAGPLKRAELTNQTKLPALN